MPRRPKLKDKPTLAADIRDLDDAALFCQAFVFHRMEPYPGGASLFGRPEFGYREVQICRCGTVRHRLCSRVTGEYLTDGWQYLWPDNYKAEGINAREDIRKEYFRRQSKAAKNGQKA